jgi:alpha-L-fucosidase
VDILAEVGQWMTINGESVYGCGAANLPKPDWGRYTQKGNMIYAHWMNPNLGQLNAKGVDFDQVKNIYLLKSGGELSYQKAWWGNNEPGNLFISIGSSPQKPVEYDTVVKIEMKK